MTLVASSLHIATRRRLQRSTETKMMVIDEDLNVIHDNIEEIIEYFKKGDVIVVNNSSTLPSSFLGFHDRIHELIEIRLLQSLNLEVTNVSNWKVTIFGKGDWRIPTEKRKNPPKIEIGKSKSIITIWLNSLVETS